MYPLEQLHSKYHEIAKLKQEARLLPLGQSNLYESVNFEYKKFEWFRIPKLYFTY